MYLYLIIVVLIIIFIIWFNKNDYTENFIHKKNEQSKKKKRFKLQYKPNLDTDEININNVKDVLMDYKKRINKIEYQLMMGFVSKDKLILPLSKRNIKKNNIETFIDKTSLKKLAGIKDDETCYPDEINGVTKDSMIGVEEDIMMLSEITSEVDSELSINPYTYEEEYNIKTENVNKLKQHVKNKGTHIYQYNDKGKEVYRIYQKGNLFTMKENTLCDLLSKKQITLTAGEKNRIDINHLNGIEIISLDSLKMVGNDTNIINMNENGIDLESDESVHLSGSYKNQIDLDKDKGTTIQSNNNIDLYQVNENNMNKGFINMNSNNIKVEHTDRVVIKVGGNILYIDKDTITVSSAKLNLFASESISIETGQLNIDAESTVINSDVQILGELQVVNGLSINGPFEHQGPSFISHISKDISLNKVNMMNTCFNHLKSQNKKKLLSIHNMQGINLSPALDNIQQEVENKLNNTEEKLTNFFKTEVLTIASKLGLAGPIKTAVQFGVKEGIELSDEINKAKQSSTILNISPDSYNVNINRGGITEVINDFFEKLKGMADEGIHKLVDPILEDITMKGEEIIDKEINKLKKTKFMRVLEDKISQAQKMAKKELDAIEEKGEELVKKVESSNIGKFVEDMYEEGKDIYDKGKGMYDEAKGKYDKGKGMYDEGKSMYDEGKSIYGKGKSIYDRVNNNDEDQDDDGIEGFSLLSKGKKTISNTKNRFKKKISSAKGKYDDIKGKYDDIKGEYDDKKDKAQNNLNRLRYLVNTPVYKIVDAEIRHYELKFINIIKTFIGDKFDKYEGTALNLLMTKVMGIFNKIIKASSYIPSATSFEISPNTIKLNSNIANHLHINPIDMEILTPLLLTKIEGPANINALSMNVSSTGPLTVASTSDLNLVSDESFMTLTPEAIEINSVAKSLTGGPSNIAGEFSVEGASNLAGDTNIEGVMNIMGETSIEGAIEVVGAVSIAGELVAANITAPVGEIGMMGGIAANSITSDMAIFSDTAGISMYGPGI